MGLKMLLSVVVPCFNVSLFVGELCSVLHNSKLDDVEFIFVDDASTDETREKIAQYADIDRRFQLSENTNNVGLSETRNNGAAIASGKYLVFVDGDDLLDVEALYLILKNDQKNSDLIVVGYEEFDDVTGETAQNQLQKAILLGVDVETAPVSLPINNPVWCHVHKTAHFKKNLEFIGRQREDRDFCFRSFFAASNISVLTAHSVFKYRVNRRDQNSIMQREFLPEGVEFFTQHLFRFLSDVKKQDPQSLGMNKQLFIYTFLKNISWEFMVTTKKYSPEILTKFAAKLTEIGLSLMTDLADLHKILHQESADPEFNDLITYLNYFSAATKTNTVPSFPHVNSMGHADQILKYSCVFDPQLEAEMIGRYVFKLNVQNIKEPIPVSKPDIIPIIGLARTHHVLAAANVFSQNLPKPQI